MRTNQCYHCPLNAYLFKYSFLVPHSSFVIPYSSFLLSSSPSKAFYEEFLHKIRDDQERFDANHPTDTGALADVVPYDGIGGNPGCPVWQVAYIVIARTMWKHYGAPALPSLAAHYEGMTRLLAWFDRHADPSDGLLVISCYGESLSLCNMGIDIQCGARNMYAGEIRL